MTENKQSNPDIILPEKNQKKALILGIGTILMWSTVSSMFKFALNSISPMQLIALGLSFASLFLGLYIIYKGKWKIIKNLPRADILNILAQGTALFAYYFFLFTAYDYLPAQIAQPINSTWAFVLAIINAWLIKEMLTKGEFLGMFLAYTGAVIISVGATSSSLFVGQISLLGIFFAVISTFFIASYWIINNRCKAPHSISLWGGFTVVAIFANITLFLQYLLDYDLHWENLQIKTLFAVIYISLFEWALAFTTWTLALKLTTSVTTMSTLSFFNPFLALIWISIILDEPILITTVIGLVFIVAGMMTQQKFKRKI